ncbi:peptidase S1 and S6 chymotrypsin/Hap [Rhodomicrobium vannielii ATCC 17100]|uniref:Peptidase S1 and S6 chymotrypsin/Hap n=1 Tax=Rhodomicrobium vannielii (strain ATCC 17100 / DSM 162 / LMG 4299 / NCIMB 10020 / ATH 3.1.1) TaxID=648757 RepID=E3I572_RHOVT|nr:DUF1986 domain-containing protein [Rhodomicrobium vannielii]ADP70522.1 peptidase S1 and S6 chymotrypsin/Hap [Rhodomicrobium vannielii ATCC 17100]
MIRNLFAAGFLCLVAPALLAAEPLIWRGLGPATERAAKACGRIVGGTCAASGDWPWQVALFVNKRKESDFSFACGGSIISRDWVLTAAHCLTQHGESLRPDAVLVLEGSQKKNSGRKIKVEQIIVHDGWNDGTKENDIALLKLAAPARSTPVALATPRDAGYETGSAVVTGWGLLRPLDILRDENGKEVPGKFVDGLSHEVMSVEDARKFVTDELMQVNLPLVTLEACKVAHRNTRDDNGVSPVIDSRVICAGDAKGGKDSCQGDSGGPLVARGGVGWVQIGVVSWGSSCALPGTPGAYTRVAAFEGWIKAKTGIDQSAPSTDTQTALEDNAAFKNPAGLSISFVQGKHLKPGRSVYAAVSARKPGYLALFNLGADGKLTRLFPSAMSRRSPTSELQRVLTPGKTLLVPDPKDPYSGFEFTIDPPAGPGWLVAVLLASPAEEIDFTDERAVIEDRASAMSYLSTIARAINRDIEVSQKGPETTSIAVFDYEILP